MRSGKPSSSSSALICWDIADWEIKHSSAASVKDLQREFGFATPQAIYKWQQGLALPTIDNLVILAMLLGVTMDDIIVVQAGTPLDKAS